ncbi:hypothetical protein [uncultured Fibrobacter sp.]|uniref:hypothetical protein n=1 Tax=uncultured Fibrobacter sp. TaxID=261512 RepID=UPI0028056DCB|nr:hypothetical protein [uncultured Fibrobacter sp.]
MTKRFCFFLCVLTSFLFAQNPVRVETFDEQGNNPLFIEGDWAGTIFAPKAKLVLGQANKRIFGRFVGNGITVHQYASLYAVSFAPETETAIAYFNMEEK